MRLLLVLTAALFLADTARAGTCNGPEITCQYAKCLEAAPYTGCVWDASGKPVQCPAVPPTQSCFAPPQPLAPGQDPAVQQAPNPTPQ
jgi:hypothetical protein